jgi:uroporphyrinogen-III synthase
MAVLREWDVPAILVPEPNTWREVLAATASRPERRIAVQEYGKSNPELLQGFQARGAEVTAVRVYQWDLPEDTGPLREAARRVAAGEFGAALFTTSIQVAHLFRIAAEEGIEKQVLDGFSGMLVASIGPTTSEALEDYGIRVDFEPSHPKMGLLVQETAQLAASRP